jgi:aldose 1-epimerase
MPIRLEAGHDHVDVDPEDGCRITSLVLAGAERLVTRPEQRTPEHVLLWGCFFMAPWVGRMERGLLDWDGRRHEFPRNFGDHAIHGLVFDKSWSVDRTSAEEASFSCDLDAVGWPFGGRVDYSVRLVPGQLELTGRISAGRERMPAALGWHPYFRRGNAVDLSVKVDSDSVLETVGDLIPTGNKLPVQGDTDLRGGPKLGSRRLDHVYADATEPALVRWPDLSLKIGFAPPLETVVVYTPPHAACVEPQTAWPNAAALAERDVEGTGLVVLERDEELEAKTVWKWS